MATPQATKSPAAPDIQTQIKEVMDQLVERCLLDVSKKYNLRFSPLTFHRGSDTFTSLLESEFYTVKIARDFRHVLVKWKLDMEALKKWIEVHGSQRSGCDWNFLGYLKEGALTFDQIKADKNFRQTADIAAKASGEVSFELTGGSRYSAVFFMVLEDSDKLVFDADVGTMIKIPQTPSLDEISILKEKLNSLMDGSGQSAGTSPSDAIKAKILNSAYDQLEIRKRLEGLGFGEGNIDEAIEDYKERFNQLFFKAM